MRQQEDLPVTVEIGEERFEISPEHLNGITVHKVDDHCYSVQDRDKTYEIQLEKIDLITGTYVLRVNGQVKEMNVLREIDVKIEQMGLNASHVQKQSLLLAPMPGLVTGIKTAKDQHVEKGAPLIILEAMKMENVISAPHDAVIRDIRVSIGQAVEKGSPLVEFD